MNTAETILEEISKSEIAEVGQAVEQAGVLASWIFKAADFIGRYC